MAQQGVDFNPLFDFMERVQTEDLAKDAVGLPMGNLSGFFSRGGLLGMLNNPEEGAPDINQQLRQQISGGGPGSRISQVRPVGPNEIIEEDVGEFQTDAPIQFDQSGLRQPSRLGSGSQPLSASKKKQLSRLIEIQRIDPKMAALTMKIIASGQTQEVQLAKSESENALRESISILNQPDGMLNSAMVDIVKERGQRGIASPRLIKAIQENDIGTKRELLKLRRDLGTKSTDLFKLREAEIKTSDTIRLETRKSELKRQEKQIELEAKEKIAATKRGKDAVLGVLTTVQNQTNPSVQVQMLEQGVADLKAQGLDARPLERIITHPQRTLRLPNLISGTIGALQPAGVTTAQLKPVTGRGAEFATSPAVTIVNPDGSISIAVPVTDKRTGETTVNNVPIAGDIIDKKFGETAEQFQQRKVDTARQSEAAKLGAQTRGIAELAKQEVQAKGAATRVQKNINTGLERAALIPVINRSLELMQLVKTGGFAAAQLRGKQLLGIESADEAELFFNLQKSVVSQLKQTFGAAFTEREGALLARIEAGFGKSTAGNIRLLEQSKKLLLIAANRGLRSAKASGDQEATREIQDLIDFKLTPEPVAETPQRNVTVDF